MGKNACINFFFFFFSLLLKELSGACKAAQVKIRDWIPESQDETRTGMTIFFNNYFKQDFHFFFSNWKMIEIHFSILSILSPFFQNKNDLILHRQTSRIE